MKEWEIEVSGMVTITVTESFYCKGETLEEAKEKAIAAFKQMLDEEYAWHDCDDIEIGDIKEER